MPSRLSAVDARASARATPAGARRRTPCACRAARRAPGAPCRCSRRARRTAWRRPSARRRSPTAPRRSCRRRRWSPARGRGDRGCRRAWPARDGPLLLPLGARHQIGVLEDLQVDQPRLDADRPQAERHRRRRQCAACSVDAPVGAGVAGRRRRVGSRAPTRRAVDHRRATTDGRRRIGRQHAFDDDRLVASTAPPGAAARSPALRSASAIAASRSRAELAAELFLGRALAAASPRPDSRAAAARSAARPRTAARAPGSRRRRPTSTARAAAPRPPRGRSGCCERPS